MNDILQFVFCETQLIHLRYQDITHLQYINFEFTSNIQLGSWKYIKAYAIHYCTTAKGKKQSFLFRVLHLFMLLPCIAGCKHG